MAELPVKLRRFLALDALRSRCSQPFTTTGEVTRFVVTTEVNADVSLWQNATRPPGEWLSAGCNDSVSLTPALDTEGLLTPCNSHVSDTVGGLISSGDEVDTWLSDGTATASLSVAAESSSTLTGDDAGVVALDSSTTTVSAASLCSLSSVDLTITRRFYQRHANVTQTRHSTMS